MPEMPFPEMYLTNDEARPRTAAEFQQDVRAVIARARAEAAEPSRPVVYDPRVVDYPAPADYRPGGWRAAIEAHHALAAAAAH